MTSNFGTHTDKPLFASTGKVLNKESKPAYGHEKQTMKVCTEPLEQLHGNARDIEILPGLETPLLCVNNLSDEEFTNVLHPWNGGVMVHGPNDINIVVSRKSIIQWWHDESGLWNVPLHATGTNLNTDVILLK